jgi:hypothetical protein
MVFTKLKAFQRPPGGCVGYWQYKGFCVSISFKLGIGHNMKGSGSNPGLACKPSF